MKKKIKLKKNVPKLLFAFIAGMLVMNGASPAQTVEAKQPTPPSGVGTIRKYNSIGQYELIGHSFMYGDVTTLLANGDNGHLYFENDKDKYGSKFQVYNYNGERRVRGTVNIAYQGGGSGYTSYVVRITPKDFSSLSIQKGRSFVDNLYAEGKVSKSKLDAQLGNGGEGWLNPIVGTRNISSGNYTTMPTMRTGKLWKDGSSAYSSPRNVFVTKQGTLDAPPYGWSANTQAAFHALFDLKVTLPSIDDDPPEITVDPNGSDWKKDNISVKIQAVDNGTGVKQMRYRLYHNTDGWGSWTSWNSSATQYTTISKHGAAYLQVQATDNAGNTGSKDSSTFRLDKIAPRGSSTEVKDARYVNGNDYWFRPGDAFRVQISGYDQDSQMRLNYLRLAGDGNDNRALHNWDDHSDGQVDEFNDGEYTEIYGGTAPYYGWTATYMFNAKLLTNSGDRNFEVQSYFQDRARNTFGYDGSGLYIKSDGTAPTVSANTSSRGWDNTNASVALTYSDTRSGIKTKQYKWSTSTATPSSWGTYTGTLTQPNNGAWYLHARAVDNVGHSTTERYGPYRVDKTAPSGSISGNPSSWTNNNVTLKLTASDSGGSGYYRTKLPDGSYSTSTTPTYTVTSDGTYSFVVYDHAGNSKTVSSTVNKIDKTLPSHTNTWVESVNQDSFYVYVDGVKDSGGSGVKEVRFPTWTAAGGQDDIQSNWATNPATVGENMGNGVWRYKVERRDHNYEFGEYIIHPYVFDNAGNRKAKSFSYILKDQVAPELSVSPSTTSWTKGNVTLTATAKDVHTGIKSITLPNGSVVTKNAGKGVSTSHSYTATTNGTYTFKATDDYGTVTSRSYKVTNIDKTAPSGTISGNPSSWTRNSVTLSFKATDDGSGVKRVRKPDGTWVNGSSTSYVVSSNGTYTFRVEDNAGNIRDVSVTVNRIDKSNPNGTISGNPTSWTRNNVTLTFNATDSGGSGVKRVRKPDGTWVNGTNTTYTVSSNGTYTFRVEDNAGNIRDVSVTVNRIDKTAPSGSISGNPSSWTNKDVTLNVSTSDSQSGVKRIKKPNGDWVNGTSTTYTVSSNGTYSFVIEDNVGNTQTVSVTVNRIDKVIPEKRDAVVYDARYTSGNNHWFRPGDTFQVEVGGYDRDSTMKYTYLRLVGDGNDNRAYHDWDKSDGYISEFDVGEYTDITGGTAPYWGWTPRYKFDGKIHSGAGNRTFQVQSYFRDQAGNTAGYFDSGKRIRTDATAPTISANPSSTSWGNGTVSVSLTHSDAHSGIDTKQYKWSTSTSTPSSWDTYSSNVSQSSQGTWYLHARAVDNVGHVSTKRFGPYRIDKTNPNGTISGNPSSWTNKDVTLSFSATDSGGSGVKRVRKPDGTWVNGSSTTHTVSSNGTYTFRVEDNAGNIKDVSVTVNRIDKTNPNGEITGNPSSWTNKNVTLTFNATDTGGAGVKRVRKPNGTWVTGSSTTHTVSSNGTYTFRVEDHAGNIRDVSVTVNRIDKVIPAGVISGNPSAWTNKNVTLTFNATDSGGSDVKRVRIPDGTWVNSSSVQYTVSSNGTYTFRVEDNAGNIKDVSVTVNRIDKTIPGGSISGNPSAWTNKNVTLTFDATDSGGSGVKRVRRPDGTWVNGATTSYTVSSNGKYTFRVEDHAGNVKDVSVTVNRIDKVIPKGTITGNPTKWTNKDITLSFNATDSGGAGVKRVRRPDGTWVNGSSTTFVVKSNGKYTFRVEDHAGNIKDVSVTVTKIDKNIPAESNIEISTDQKASRY